MPSTSSKERDRFFGAGLATLENMGPPLGNAVFGETGGAAMPDMGGRGAGLDAALTDAALRAAGAGMAGGAATAGARGGGGGGAIAGAGATGGKGFSAVVSGAGLGATRGE